MLWDVVVEAMLRSAASAAWAVGWLRDVGAARMRLQDGVVSRSPGCENRRSLRRYASAESVLMSTRRLPLYCLVSRSAVAACAKIVVIADARSTVVTAATAVVAARAPAVVDGAVGEPGSPVAGAMLPEAGRRRSPRRHGSVEEILVSAGVGVTLASVVVDVETVGEHEGAVGRAEVGW